MKPPIDTSRLRVAARVLLLVASGSAAEVPLPAPAPTPTPVARAPEPTLKAAFLYNFALFVEWPEEARKGPLLICVLGTDPFGEVLPATLRSKTANGRKLRSAVAVTAAEIAPCSVLYVPAAESATHRRILDTLAGRPILTVGESEEFLDAGGIIRLFLDGGRLRFEVNAAAAERSRLKVSAQLLELSRKGTKGPGERAADR